MPSDIFRREAIDYHAGARSEGELLLLPPEWTRWTYRLLLVCLVATLAFLTFGSVSRYADGPALIRAERRIAVTANTPGIVASVRATPGMRVARGDLLLRFRSTDEEAQLGSVQREFDLLLLRMLANPLDQTARQTLSGLRAQKELLAARLAERLVRAPEAGTVGDVRVKPGQNVTPGELIVSIAHEQAGFNVVALLPGQQRPVLRQGQILRLEIAGYPYAYQTSTIQRIDNEVVGPYEVRRVLGAEVADSISISGPVVVVHAHLPETTFKFGDERYSFFDGMPATARVRVSSERLLNTVLPSLKSATDQLR